MGKKSVLWRFHPGLFVIVYPPYPKRYKNNTDYCICTQIKTSCPINNQPTENKDENNKLEEGKILKRKHTETEVWLLSAYPQVLTTEIFFPIYKWKKYAKCKNERQFYYIRFSRNEMVRKLDSCCMLISHRDPEHLLKYLKQKLDFIITLFSSK